VKPVVVTDLEGEVLGSYVPDDRPCPKAGSLFRQEAPRDTVKAAP
jgi:hypothetical protein